MLGQNRKNRAKPLPARFCWIPFAPVSVGALQRDHQWDFSNWLVRPVQMALPVLKQIHDRVCLGPSSISCSITVIRHHCWTGHTRHMWARTSRTGM